MTKDNKKPLKDFVYVFESTTGELSMLVGPLDENLRQIETAFDAKIYRRGNHFRIAGSEAPKAFAARVLRRTRARRRRAHRQRRADDGVGRADGRRHRRR